MQLSERLRLGVAAAAVTAGVVVLVADVPGESATAADPVEASAAVQDQADAVFESFSGSRLERDAGAVLAARALNGGMDQCMEQAGFPEWDWSMPRAQNPSTRGLASSEFFAEPLARTFTTTTLESSDSIKADAAARTAVLSGEEDEAVGACLESVPPTSEAAAQSTPPEAAALREEWWSMLDSLDDKYGDATTYAECLASTPMGGLGTISSREEATGALSALLPSVDLLPTSQSDPKVDGAAWKSLLAAEAVWEEVDWGCRASVYNNHLADVAAAIDGFATENAERIQQAELAWDATLQEAEALGFRGSYGPIVDGGA